MFFLEWEQLGRNDPLQVELWGMRKSASTQLAWAKESVVVTPNNVSGVERLTGRGIRTWHDQE